MTKARTIADLGTGFVNITDTGTEGTKVASGTTAQRGSTTGQWRFNSTTGFFEGRGASTFTSLEPTPIVSSSDVTDVDSAAGGSQTFVITGQEFTSGGTIAFVANDNTEFNADTTTFNSSTQVTAVKTRNSFQNAKEPYKVRFTSSSGKIGISSVGLISVDTSPTWNTAAGNLGNIYHDINANHFTLSATDAEGDAIVYSETGGTNITGAGLTLSNAGVISGNANDVSSDTTVSFTGRATANGKNVDRSFSFVVKPALGSSTNPATSAKQLYDAGYTTDGAYYINNDFTGGSARNCYCRFNTRDGVHWHRWSPRYLSGYSLTKDGGNSSSINNTTINYTTSPDLSQNDNDSNRDFQYVGNNSGAGVSGLVSTGLQLSDLDGFYLGFEMRTSGTGDGGNRGFFGLDWQSSNSTSSNWGHQYSPEANIIQNGRDATNQTNVRNFAAVKFASSGSNVVLSRDTTAIGSMFGHTGTINQLWSRYTDTSNAGYDPGSSGQNADSYTISATDYWAIRIGGWSDTGNYLEWFGIHWVGNK